MNIDPSQSLPLRGHKSHLLVFFLIHGYGLLPSHSQCKCWCTNFTPVNFFDLYKLFIESNAYKTIFTRVSSKSVTKVRVWSKNSWIKVINTSLYEIWINQKIKARTRLPLMIEDLEVRFGNLVLNWVTPQSNLIKAWLNGSGVILP